MVLSGFITAFPWAGVLTAVKVRGSPSTSLSLFKTGITTATSSSVLTESSTATGTSFTATTSIVTIAVELEIPSEIV